MVASAALRVIRAPGMGAPAQQRVTIIWRVRLASFGQRQLARGRCHQRPVVWDDAKDRPFSPAAMKRLPSRRNGVPSPCVEKEGCANARG